MAQTTKVDQEEEVHCRICLDDCGKMLMACECAGSVRFVHEECLRTWVMERMAKTPKQSLDKVCAPVHRCISPYWRRWNARSATRRTK